jgi:hypothetical protein
VASREAVASREVAVLREAVVGKEAAVGIEEDADGREVVVGMVEDGKDAAGEAVVGTEDGDTEIVVGAGEVTEVTTGDQDTMEAEDTMEVLTTEVPTTTTGAQDGSIQDTGAAAFLEILLLTSARASQVSNLGSRTVLQMQRLHMILTILQLQLMIHTTIRTMIRTMIRTTVRTRRMLTAPTLRQTIRIPKFLRLMQRRIQQYFKDSRRQSQSSFNREPHKLQQFQDQRRLRRVLFRSHLAVNRLLSLAQLHPKPLRALKHH